MEAILEKLGFKRIGMTPDMEFTCDFCDQFEYYRDENGECHWIAMYKGPDKKDYCEYCLGRMTFGL